MTPPVELTLHGVSEQQKSSEVVNSLRYQHLDARIVEMKTQISEVETSLKTELANSEARTRADMVNAEARAHERFNSISNRMWVAAGGIILLALGVIGWLVAMLVEFQKLRGH